MFITMIGMKNYYLNKENYDLSDDLSQIDGKKFAYNLKYNYEYAELYKEIMEEL